MLLQIKIAIAVGVLAVSNYITYQYVTGQQAKKEVKIITNQVENHNEDTIALQEHNRLMEEISRAHVAELDSIEPIRLPPITIYETANIDDCLLLINEYERMWNETIGITNRVSFENGGD